MAQILIVDEDESAQGYIKHTLMEEGFGVLCASHGKEALAMLERAQADLIILDVMLPQTDGWQLVRELRRIVSAPILILTARGEYEDIIRGFQLGSDDYLTKPFHPGELVMRVRALLKRYRIAASARIEVGDLMIDRSMHEVRIGQVSMCLPLKEFQLLFTLASYPGQILTRGQIIEQVWGVNYAGDERTVDVHIKRLRSRIGAMSSRIALTTVRGLGYRLDVTGPGTA
ncbi:response regulator transcription factor [Paenibacillus hexagrammi]|uniref:Heme response regulator HssR n=1 Tax=Paenibacillus hexagrammi TaxID=2908839 RepID=A0ABY3SGK3_9BACL|nr:response regulator transcription factor [Paenibacillus sp. YPD9-1]UJF32854.1 response regulator transcription factor [Paenibacillus sp. YPD9-1]